ncbi:hypothetical protein EYB26_003001 [Talaromyces marneffei]|uniref:uncharacterized protein n=1 Tax=Talaromyces marneffei TaxID=37727 RepID=UPI0012A93461|nr:uncharacterized protein EYB26_003001 [Talaromyces marneffei]QGA15344.1 hypothetical protein EYB26_003001 [Talaromyces marneffei]
MMAPVRTNGKIPPRRMFIDLTQDSEDETDDEDVTDQAKVLLDAFTKSKAGESRPLKRKSPADEAAVREPRTVPAVKHEIFSHQEPPRPINGVNDTVDHNASVAVNSPKQWAPLAAPGKPLKRESRGSTPKPFAAVAPRSSASLQSHVISSNSSSRNNSKNPTLPPATRLPASLQSEFDSSSVSSGSSSERPTFITRKKATPRRTRSPSVVITTRRMPQVMVVVPPPPSAHTSGTRLSKRKVNRLPSASPEGEVESDPDEPKGVQQKYYPIDMYDLQAEMGRYPQARSTNSRLVVLPTCPVPPYDSVNRAHPKTPHSQKLYLRELLEKKLRKIQGPPVTMARDWDGTGSLASNFEFTNTYKLQKGVTRADEGFNYGCDCGTQCDPSRCTCLSKEEEEDSEELMVPYEHRNGKLLLKEDFINRKVMIYECSSLCPCLPTCWNRLVQHGRKIRLEIFHTGNRGFGLRSLDFIHGGQFIDIYLGEVITSAEAELREDATMGSNGSHTSPSYLFSLDWFPPSSEDDDDDEEEEGGTHYVVDGQRFGGPSRFMNHSCNPNCKMIPVSTHHGDQKIYDLAFFARRDIPPGVELTFDYNPGWSPEMNSDDPNAVKCLCGEARCRGQLWPNQRKSTNVRSFN